MLDTKVEKLMIPIKSLERVFINDSLKEVVKIFISKNNSKERCSILAISDKEKFIGILTIGDILKVVKKLMKMYSHKEMKAIGSLSAYGQKEFVSNLENQMDTGVDLKAKDLMTIRSPALSPNDTTSKAFDLMLEKNLRVLPVFDNNNVVGIIREVDLLDCIVDFIER